MRTDETLANRVRDPAQRVRIEEEIAILEKRLDQIGPDGDCGYENAMIRFFQAQIDMRRQRLAFAAGSPLTA